MNNDDKIVLWDRDGRTVFVILPRQVRFQFFSDSSIQKSGLNFLRFFHYKHKNK